MRDSDRPKPAATAGTGSSKDKPVTATTSKDGSAVPPTPADRKAGRIVHDERGNAVWDWLVETGRIFIGNTSRLLKRLEAPELKIEEEASPEEMRLESDRDTGGGYDPYGRSTGQSGGAGSSRGPAASNTKPDGGGGYDPYSSGPARKKGRKG